MLRPRDCLIQSMRIERIIERPRLFSSLSGAAIARDPDERMPRHVLRSRQKKKQMPYTIAGIDVHKRMLHVVVS